MLYPNKKCTDYIENVKAIAGQCRLPELCFPLIVIFSKSVILTSKSIM